MIKKVTRICIALCLMLVITSSTAMAASSENVSVTTNIPANYSKTISISNKNSYQSSSFHSYGLIHIHAFGSGATILPTSYKIIVEKKQNNGWKTMHSLTVNGSISLTNSQIDHTLNVEAGTYHIRILFSQKVTLSGKIDY